MATKNWDDATITTGDSVTASEWVDMAQNYITANYNFINALTATTAEINYTDGVTSNLQTQLDSKLDALATITQKTASFSVASTDSGDIINCTVTATCTLPTDVSTGFQVVVINDGTAGTETVTFSSAGTIKSKSSAVDLANQYGAATAVYQGSNNWYLFGDLS